MPLSPGTRIGVFEVVALLGVGGMGEVYRARDTRLQREVAIKVLPEAFAMDADRLTRFTREAQVLASLNHPNIAQIYGFERTSYVGRGFSPAGSAGPEGPAYVQALVLELVEGETLADRIVRGALPIDEALPIAKQIADALEAAHEQGIIHRDLKPANIKVRPDGTVKVLDFGLAKAMEPASAATPSASQAPTITTPALITGVGVILGTAAYMSPEQARGKPVDKRADIWAFGCLLYEMLTGVRAFSGDDIVDVIGAVIHKEPNWKLLPPAVPAGVRRLLRRALDKDNRKRLDSVVVARLELDEALFEPGHLASVASSQGNSRERIAWVTVVLLLALAATTLGTFYLRQPVTGAPEARLDITTPGSTSLRQFALSPDGSQIVYRAAGSSGVQQLWIRRLDTGTSRPLADTDGGGAPFWSPDGQSLGFFADSQLKVLDLRGGRPKSLAASTFSEGTWGADGLIVYSPGSTTGLKRISVMGGEPVDATQLDDRRASHRNPRFLPDGRRFVFYVEGEQGAGGLHLGAVDTLATTRLGDSDSTADYLAPGLLLFARSGALVAHAFDVVAGTMSVEGVTVADSVDTAGIGGSVGVSTARTGLVAYRVRSGTTRQLQWFDRSGKMTGTLGDATEDNQITVELSPDGQRALTYRTVRENLDLWVVDGARSTRLTRDPGDDLYGVWSHDGRRVIFASTRTGGDRDLYERPADGGDDMRLRAAPGPQAPNDISPDGKLLLLRTGNDVEVLSLGPNQATSTLIQSDAFDEGSAQWSPDGRWIAYQSNESGRWEIYVRPFPNKSTQWQVSTKGGANPRWRADGSELFFVDPDGTLMAVPVSGNAQGFVSGTPLRLFKPNMFRGNDVNRQQYDVAPDGRFLVNVEVASPDTPITLILNWKLPVR